MLYCWIFCDIFMLNTLIESGAIIRFGLQSEIVISD